MASSPSPSNDTDKPATGNPVDPNLGEQASVPNDAVAPGDAQLERRDGAWQHPYPPGGPPTSAYPLTLEQRQDGMFYDPRGPPPRLPYGPPAGVMAPWGYMPPAGYYPGYVGPPPHMMYPPPGYYPPPPPFGQPVRRPQAAGGNSTDEVDENGNPVKTKADRAPKAYIACHYCRMRKIKCDGTRPECGTCARYGQRECSYDDERRKRGPAKKKKGETSDVTARPKPRNLPSLKQALEPAMNAHTPQVPYVPVMPDHAVTAAAIMSAIPAISAQLARAHAQVMLPAGTAAEEAPAPPAMSEASAPAKDTTRPAAKSSRAPAKAKASAPATAAPSSVPAAAAPSSAPAAAALAAGPAPARAPTRTTARATAAAAKVIPASVPESAPAAVDEASAGPAKESTRVPVKAAIKNTIPVKLPTRALPKRGKKKEADDAPAAEQPRKRARKVMVEEEVPEDG